MIDCVLIIVAYNSAGDIRELLDSVPDAAGALSWSAIVVNNSPQDDLTDVLEPYRQVTLVTPGQNLGFAGGLNAGLAVAEPSRVVAFLNPDLTLEPGALQTLADAVDGAQEGTVWAAVPAILDEHGGTRPSLRREPSLLGALGEALFGNHWPNRPAALSEIVRDPARYRSAHAVDWATGAALLVRRDVVDSIGPWDSRFFLYSEEIDYCRRIRRRGGGIWFVPDAAVRHRESGSGSSAQLDALLEVNKVRYFRKWHPALPSAAFGLATILRNALRCYRPNSRAALRALLSRRTRAALPRGGR